MSSSSSSPPSSPSPISYGSAYELVLPLSAFSSSSKATDRANNSNEIASSSFCLPHEYSNSPSIWSEGNIPILAKRAFREFRFTKASPGCAAASKACRRSMSSAYVNISSTGMNCALNFARSLFVRSIALSKMRVGSSSFSSLIGGST